MNESDIKTNSIKKVLVVDDDPISFLITAELFKNDFDLYFALSPKVAIDQASKIHFDIIIVDLFLGVDNFDGIELIKIISKDKMSAHSKFISISSSIQPRDKARILEAGYHSFFQKPLKRSDFMEFLS